MKQVFLYILFYLVFLSGSDAQNVVITTGEAQREISRNESRDEAEKKVEELATINAIENAFGRVVIQGNSTFMENISDGRKTETRSIFNTIANTFVKGELLDVVDKKIVEIRHTVKIDGKKSELIDLKCTMKIKARELTEPAIDFRTHTGPCEDEFVKCESVKFKYGDNIYLYFRSPESGFLNVFADQEGTTSKLLPYSGADAAYENGMPIKSNFDYLFFSKRNNPYGNINCSPLKAYEAPGKSYETYRFFIIFSKSPLPPPMVLESKQTYTSASNSEAYKLPNSLKSEEFQYWLQKIKVSNAKCNVVIKDISIEK